MGLLEKAYKYKKEINRQGKETLIDTIKGPAETDFIDYSIGQETDHDAETHEADTSPDTISTDTNTEQSESDTVIQNQGSSSLDQVSGMQDSTEGNVPDNSELIEDDINVPVIEKDDLMPVDLDSFELSEHDLNMYKDISSDASTGRSETDESPGGDDEDYDLFSLPEDTESPLDVLEHQKSGTGLNAGKDDPEDSVISGNDVLQKTTGYMLSDDDPFGVDDEPKINQEAPQDKKNVDAASTQSEENMIDSGTTGVANHPVPQSPVRGDDYERSGDNTAANSMASSRDTGNAGDVDKFNKTDTVPAASGDRLSDEVSARKDKKFQDFIVLYEIGKEILRSESRKQLYDVILFSIMGQIGASSSSIMITDSDNEKRWKIGDSRGVTIRNKDLTFDIEDSILKLLLDNKEIIDLEDFKNNQLSKDEYYKFVSIDGRLVSPLNYNGIIIGAVVMGDKITIGDYSDEEKDFIISVSEISAIALHKINTIESLQQINESQKNELALVTHVDGIKEKLISDTSLSRLKDVVHEEFNQLGIISYAAFLRSDRFDEYSLVLNERDDILGLRESNMSIRYGHPFIEYVNELKECVKIDDFKRMKVFSDTFTDRQIKLMSYLWIYPFKLGSHLEGFFIVTDINDSTREKEIHSKISRLTMVLFSYILNIKNLDTHELMYVDYVEPVMKRVERELIHAKNLRIPLTIILFSIKNFKRYYSLFGKEEANKVLHALEEIIRTRLAEPDFSVRYDRNKFLIVLPGKNKKYSIPLANTIRNEVLQNYKRKEMQLLVTFLTAEFPEDGDDIHTLMDSID